jgi:Uma2 family endonuclease
MSTSAYKTIPTGKMTIAEYLAFENAAETKHEYVDGRILDMAGAHPDHVLVNMNIAGEIRNALEGKPCRTYGSDLRIRIKKRARYRYPDVAVICGPREVDVDDPMAVTNPRVIVEVLSGSTEFEDRFRKFSDYRTIDGFEEFVMVSRNHAVVEVYFRQSDGTWKMTPYEGLDAEITIQSLGIRILASRVYAGLVLQPE